MPELKKQSVEIRTKDTDLLKKVESIISNTFGDKVGLPSRGRTIDSPNKADIGNLALGFNVTNLTPEDPFEIGRSMIGHLRSNGIACRRGADVKGEVDENGTFHDVIELH